MKIYDITQEVFNSAVFPGDPSPKREVVKSMEEGELYNLTAIYMSAHNGTHVDAPYHFYREGRTVEALSLERLIGTAYVVEHTGSINEADAKAILLRARAADKEAGKRIIIKGKAVVSLEAAKVFAAEGVWLIGNESQTVGPEDAPMAVHKVLLCEEVVLLEGIRLKEVPEGVYLLNAAPIKLGGADGAPCRAVLIDERHGNV